MKKINLRTTGIIFILSSPSSCGKSTLTKNLLALEDNLKRPISVTTRDPRNSEINHVDYSFISMDEFKIMSDNGDLLETTCIYENYYGTPKFAIENAISTGQDLILNIDWNGASNIAQIFPDHTVRIFILPPSLATLKNRIDNRGEDDQNSIDLRMSKVRQEVVYSMDYDYVVINDNFDIAIAEIRCIFTAERAKKSRLSELRKFLEYAEER